LEFDRKKLTLPESLSHPSGEGGKEEDEEEYDDEE
jgi:hypothetical protein